MAVTEQQRHRLLTWFEEHMGQDLGASMMELMPPTDASQLATKADLDTLRTATKADLDTLRTATKADLDTLRTATKADLGTLRAEIRADVKDDLLQLQRTFGTWLFASQAAVIAVVGVVTALA